MLILSLALALAAPEATPRPSQNIPRLPDSNYEERDDYDPPVRENCPVPRPSNDERTVLLGFGAGSGSAIPNHSVAGLDGMTTTGEIRVGPGPGGIFLVLNAHDPIIYRLSGHVERISRVVLLSRSDAGITGVKASKVSFGIGNNCFLGVDGIPPSTASAFRSLFGREPAAIGGDDEFHIWILGASGAGRAIPAPHHRPEPKATYLEEQMDWHYPGGVVKIELEQLISSRTAMRYPVLPATAGALQLEQAGAIVRATREEIDDWRAKARVRYGKQVAEAVGADNVYRVTRHITLPAHLCGALSISFLTSNPQHVSGKPCHSDIIGTDGRIYHLAGHYDPEELNDAP